MQQHLESLCPLRLTQCKWHGTHEVAMQELQKHELTCPFRDITCINSCGAVYKVKEADSHLTKFCPNRLVECRLLCRESFPLSEHDHHEKTQCPMRAVFCPLGCNMFPIKIRAKNLEAHIRDECPHREV